MMKKFKSLMDKALETVIIVLMGANVLNVLWQVFTRFIMNNPSSFTEELARYLLIWVGLLTAAYIVSLNQHLAIDLLQTKVSAVSRKSLELIVHALIFIFALFVLIVGGVRLVFITLELNQISAALQIHLGYVYTVLPLSGLIICFYSAYAFAERIFTDSEEGGAVQC